MDKKIKTIGMVVAMDKEVTPFLKSVGSSLTVEKKGPFEIFSCMIDGKKIHLIKSGIGEIFASSATQLLISEYKVDIILNFGVCGSLVKEVGVMQTVIVKGVVHYDFDLSLIDDVDVGQYPDMPSPIIETNSELLLFAKGVMSGISEVICASADKFVAKESDKIYLNSKFNAEVCDMESAGVLLTARGFKIPCLIIKAVSDGEGGAEEFNLRVHEASKAYISVLLQLVKEM